MNPTEDLHVAIDWNRAFTFFLNQQCDSDVKGRDLIHIEAGSKCWIETYTGAVVITRAGLCTFTSLGNVFTIVCGTWDLLKTRTPGPNLIEEITEACRTQESLESDGHRTPTRYLLRALKKLTRRTDGRTDTTAQGFFKNTSRDPRSETSWSRRWDFKERERNTWNEVLIGMTGDLKSSHGPRVD